VSLQTLALWFVCGLGTAILVAAMPLSRAGAGLGVLAFAVGAWWARQPFAPSAATVATGAALVAVWQIVRAPRRPYALIVAGLLAGIWTAVLEVQGLPLLAAVPVAALLPATSAWLRTERAAFAPPALVEEALLLLAIVGLAAAALPGIAEGWHAAVNLSVRGGQPATGTPETTMPVWTLAVASAALISGGLFSIWSRR
jgi:hypothetical protein